MRFHYRSALLLLFVFVLGNNVLGAPNKGRYMWVNCKPDGKNANCVQNKGPWMDLPGPSQRLPPSAAKDIVPVELGEDTLETETEEQSGESSGDLEPEKKQDWMDDGPAMVVQQVEEPVLEEEASGEIDYSDYVYPEQVEQKLSPEDLKEDNMIQ